MYFTLSVPQFPHLYNGANLASVSGAYGEDDRVVVVHGKSPAQLLTPVWQVLFPVAATRRRCLVL